MRDDDFLFLRSPVDRSKVSPLDTTTLLDASGNKFPIVRDIPRFVDQKNYADSFGLQWNTFGRTQIDKFNGTTISHERFFRDTHWSPAELYHRKVLEVGSGAGRFTQILLETGAEVFSVDYSAAVDANSENNSGYDTLHLYQADIYRLPFGHELFDNIVCFGVLQHTPDPEKAFKSLLPFLKKGGEIAVDVYPKTWKTFLWSKYWYRPITKRIRNKILLRILRWILPKWMPISTFLLRIPRVGFYLSQMIPNSNYTFIYPQLSKEQILEWAILDTFDMLTPRFDKPQTVKTLRRWFTESGLEIKYCGEGANGFVAMGRKPE